jgi:hypothetical protein
MTYDRYTPFRIGVPLFVSPIERFYRDIGTEEESATYPLSDGNQPARTLARSHAPTATVF